MSERKEHFPTKYGLEPSGVPAFPPSGGCYTQEFGMLDVISLTKEQHAQTCGYWYLVQTACRAHTAFHSREHLLTWLEDRGLVLTGEPAMAPEHSVVTAEGRYRRTSHMSYDAFFSLPGKRVRLLDNGDYTLGIITYDEDGVATEHHLNCNMRDRPIFEYEASRQAVG